MQTRLFTKVFVYVKCVERLKADKYLLTERGTGKILMCPSALLKTAANTEGLEWHYF